jgi:hypothetical protein
VPPAVRHPRHRILGHMPLRVAVVAMASLLAAAGLTACDSEEEPEKPAPSAASTPLADFATDTVTIARGEFCSRVAPAAVEEALGAAPEDAVSWANGDRASIAPGVRDVAHEYGCTWKAADGTVARAWVFAPPVTAAQANALRRATTGKGCRPLPHAPAYGAPSVAVRCGAETAFHGLFGDAWLSCSLESRTGEPDALLDRTGQWCVTVAQAASA